MVSQREVIDIEHEFETTGTLFWGVLYEILERNGITDKVDAKKVLDIGGFTDTKLRAYIYRRFE